MAVVPSRYDNSTVTNIPDVGTIFSTNVVAGFVGPVLKVTVSLWLTHPIDSDLSLSLISPDGISVPLTINTGSGANFGSSCSPDGNRTTFDDGAATAITAVSPPFIGTFRPQGTLSSFIGGTANGNWRLQVTDSFAGSVGALRCWSLFLDGVNCGTGSGACDTCIPPIAASISAASPVQTNRWNRELVVSSCGLPKAWSGFGNTGTNYHYNAYTFTNTSAVDACVSVELQSASDLMAALYVNSYDPTTISNNFLGDAGSSTGGGLTTFSATVPAGATCIVVVNEVNQGSGTQPFTLTVVGLPCPPPFLAIDPLIPTPNVHLHWPSWAGGYNLEATPSLFPSNWTIIPNEPIVAGNQYNVTNAETPVSRYYRLHKP
jgi:subtilisin-like proprotein convertase family protein